MAYQDLLNKWKRIAGVQNPSYAAMREQWGAGARPGESLAPGEYSAFGTWSDNRPGPVVTNVPESKQPEVLGKQVGPDLYGSKPIRASRVGPVESFPSTEAISTPNLPQQFVGRLGIASEEPWRVQQDQTINPTGEPLSPGEAMKRRLITGKDGGRSLSVAERQRISRELEAERRQATPDIPPAPTVSDDGQWLLQGNKWVPNPYRIEAERQTGRETLQRQRTESQERMFQQRLETEKSQFAQRYGLQREQLEEIIRRDKAGEAQRTEQDKAVASRWKETHDLAERRFSLEQEEEAFRKQQATGRTITEERKSGPLGTETTTRSTTKELGPEKSAADVRIGESFDRLEKDIKEGRWRERVDRLNKLKMWLDANPDHPLAKQAKRILNDYNLPDWRQKENTSAK